jgi:MinD superfamily P-loop ATPase
VVCINKYDLNEENTRQIEGYCASQRIRVAARIPFDNAVTEAMVRGVPVVEYSDGRVSREIERLWGGISGELKSLAI